MADSPDPDSPHTHLYEPHLLKRARAAAAADTSARAVVACVICSATTVLAPPARGEGVVIDVPVPPPVVRPSLEVQQVEVTGHVEATVVTWQRGTWRVVIAGVVVFAREGDGCAQALRAAGQGGEEVRVLTRRVRADLWVDAVHRR